MNEENGVEQVLGEVLTEDELAQVAGGVLT